MFSYKQNIFAVILISYLVIGVIDCAPGVDTNNLSTRVRRSPQFPGVPGEIPGIPTSIPGSDVFKNIGSSFAKNIPGADTFASSIPRISRSISAYDEYAAAIIDALLNVRAKREARGTGGLPTKSG